MRNSSHFHSTSVDMPTQHSRRHSAGATASALSSLRRYLRAAPMYSTDPTSAWATNDASRGQVSSALARLDVNIVLPISGLRSSIVPGAITVMMPCVNVMNMISPMIIPAPPLASEDEYVVAIQQNRANPARMMFGPTQMRRSIPPATVTIRPMRNVARPSTTACAGGPHRYPEIATDGATGINRCDSSMRVVMSERIAAAMRDEPNRTSRPDCRTSSAMRENANTSALRPGFMRAAT
jgi:hypothetical protein